MPATTKSTVTVKQGAPSKPGEVVDTSKAKAKAVPPSAEVKAETAKRGKNPKPATKKATAAKAKPKNATPSGLTVKGNPFTQAWTGKDGANIAKGDRVKCSVTGVTGIVTMRWTRPKDRVPCVSVEPTGTEAAAELSVGGRSVKTVGIPAAQLVHTK